LEGHVDDAMEITIMEITERESKKKKKEKKRGVQTFGTMFST